MKPTESIFLRIVYYAAIAAACLLIGAGIAIMWCS